MRPISSEIIDLPLVTVLAPAARQMSRTMSRASSAVAAQCTWPPAAVTLRLVGLEIEVEMRQRVVLDVARAVAQRLELRQRVDRLRALVDEAARAHGRAPSAAAASASAPVAFSLKAARCVMRHARVSALRADRRRRRSCRPAPRRRGAPRRGEPSRFSLPAMFIRQPRSPASSVSAPVAAMCVGLLASTMALEMSGYFTQNVPPKPQQTSAPCISISSRPVDAGEQLARLRA